LVRVEQYVNLAARARRILDRVELAALYTGPNGLSGDAEDLRGLRYTDTTPVLAALGLCSVLSHGPMLYPSEVSRNPLEAILVALTLFF
jgi:hypothetical protein